MMGRIEGSQNTQTGQRGTPNEHKKSEFVLGRYRIIETISPGGRERDRDRDTPQSPTSLANRLAAVDLAKDEAPATPVPAAWQSRRILFSAAAQPAQPLTNRTEPLPPTELPQ